MCAEAQICNHSRKGKPRWQDTLMNTGPGWVICWKSCPFNCNKSDFVLIIGIINFILFIYPFIHCVSAVQSDFDLLQESPPAWTQEAYQTAAYQVLHLLSCTGGGGVPLPGGVPNPCQGGTPPQTPTHQTWLRGTPSLPGRGTPPWVPPIRPGPWLGHPSS